MKSISRLAVALVACCLLATAANAQSDQADDKVKIADAKEFAKWIAGPWKVDVDKSLELAEKSEADESHIAQVEEMGNMKVKFNADGGLDVAMDALEMDGDWDVDSFETKEDKMMGVIATAVNDPGGNTQDMDLNVIVIGANEIKIWPENEGEENAIVMIREKKKDK